MRRNNCRATAAHSGSGIVFFRTVAGAQNAMANACRVGTLAGVLMVATKELTEAVATAVTSSSSSSSSSVLPLTTSRPTTRGCILW